MPTRLILQESDGNVQVLLDREGQIVSDPYGQPFPLSLRFRWRSARTAAVRSWVEAQGKGPA